MQNWMSLLQVVTFLLGVGVTTLSALLCIYFARSTKPIGRSVSLMLAGETISGAVTVLFSGNSLANSISGLDNSLWNSIPPGAAIGMRWVMFCAMGASSIHLAFAVRNILKDHDRGSH